jgi:hypothetical protein
MEWARSFAMRAFPEFVRRFAAGGAEVRFNLSNDGSLGWAAARGAGGEYGSGVADGVKLSHGQTLNTQWGGWFAWVCAVVALRWDGKEAER